jgi:hypothetical protein
LSFFLGLAFNEVTTETNNIDKQYKHPSIQK